MRSLLLGALLLFLVVPALTAGSGSHPSASGLVINPISPTPLGTISSQTPNITATFSDAGASVIPGSVLMFVDNLNVTATGTLVVTPTRVTYLVPSILKLANGNHTVTVSASDNAGNHAEYSWGFVVDTSLPPSGNPLIGLSPISLILYVAVGAAVVSGGYGGYILYLKRTRKFTYRKYFATHPLNKDYLVLVIPLVVAFLVVLVGLGFIFGARGAPTLSPEYLFILGAFIGMLPYALDARRERRRMRAYERSFAQFLFEMADAMRGGLDPARAIVELSKTHTDILAKGLRVAADGIQVGRPFDDVLKSMALPMRSPLITRYAELIADASSVGGETAIVVHRAAKDMDDFIKLEAERSARLTLPVAVLYIAFAVLMAVLFALLSIAPSLGSINTSFFSGAANPLSGASAAPAPMIPKLGVSTLRERFFDLMLINAFGTGVIIGAFTEGKPKYGLLHSLGLLLATAVAFLIFAH
ncbi:MAG: type II secretion system F family protein [Thermoplasmata archaeon]|nr:type II secretion system F family protein [Thermoplasmata archaeon]